MFCTAVIVFVYARYLPGTNVSLMSCYVDCDEFWDTQHDLKFLEIFCRLVETVMPVLRFHAVIVAQHCLSAGDA